jgi:transcription termination factor NusB
MNAPRTSLMRKRASRLAAAQALYARALTHGKTKPDVLIAQVLQSWKDSKTSTADDLPYDTQPEAALASKVFLAAIDKSERIETAIDELILPQWKKSRMSLPLLSVLRACAAEALAFPGRPRGLLVEEYTEVAAQLIGDDELQYAHKGFNLLLDALVPAS